VIRNEIEKRHTSNKLYKSLKTDTLQQWYEATRSLEIHNELERRKRAKEIGSFSTCTDMQLQHAIHINTTKIKMNAMVTRDTSKRKPSNFYKPQRRTKKALRTKQNTTKKSTIGVIEHKDNFDVTDSETDTD
jgi:hypothetical protein